MGLIDFLKKPSVLLFGGIVGFIATNVFTAKATYNFIKAKEALDRDTTLKEDIALGAKCYAGAIAMGAVSTGLIFGGNKSYATAQAGLVTGYTLLNTKYKNYRDAALKTLGIEKFKEIDTKVIDYNHKKNFKVIESRKPVHEGMVVAVDPFSNPDNPTYTETTLDQLSDARYEFVKLIALNGSATVNEFRELINVYPEDPKERMLGEEYGYSEEYIYDMDEKILNIDIVMKLDNKGNPYYYFEFNIEPTVLSDYR